MRKYLLFILISSALVYSCTQSPQGSNTKTDITTVNKETSQPIVTTEKPIADIPPEEDEQSDTPNNPLPPSGEAVVTKTNTSQTDATAPSPSPERTNVSPAKEVANKRTPDDPPATDNQKDTPTITDNESLIDSPSTPANTVSKSEEKEVIKASNPPISSDVKEQGTKPQNPPSLSHQAWDELLKKYVSSTGKVNYAGITGEKAKLEGYLQNLSNNPPQGTWSRNKIMAYWVNAYNAFTVKLIVDNYPVTSITKLNGGKPWDKKWIKIGDQTYSLNNIENDILRPIYKDARIHFAVNCAAKSCPPLLNRAWTEDNLIVNFDKQAKAFINNSSFNNISAKNIQVSKIFEWYAADFGNLIDYLNKYSDTKINQNAKVEFMEYNWDLNQ